MNGKKAKLLRKVAQAASTGLPDREYTKSRGTVRLSNQCTRRKYKALKAQYKNGVITV